VVAVRRLVINVKDNRMSKTTNRVAEAGEAALAAANAEQVVADLEAKRTACVNMAPILPTSAPMLKPVPRCPSQSRC
jgi:hypothetical protein